MGATSKIDENTQVALFAAMATARRTSTLILLGIGLACALVISLGAAILWMGLSSGKAIPIWVGFGVLALLIPLFKGGQVASSLYWSSRRTMRAGSKLSSLAEASAIFGETGSGRSYDVKHAQINKLR